MNFYRPSDAEAAHALDASDSEDAPQRASTGNRITTTASLKGNRPQQRCSACGKVSGLLVASREGPYARICVSCEANA